MPARTLSAGVAWALRTICAQATFTGVGHLTEACDVGHIQLVKAEAERRWRTA